MRKNLLYPILIIASIIGVGGIILLVVTQKPAKKTFDQRVTLAYKDKRPYGAFVAYQELPRLFPGALITRSKRTEGFLHDLDDSDRNQLMVVLSPQFYPNNDEWNSLIRWVQQGNYLVVSANRFSQDARDQLHIQLSSLRDEMTFENSFPESDDSLRIGLSHPPYGDTETYFYPGKKYDRSAVSLDSSFTDVLGTNDMHYANLIRIRAGKGVVLVQMAPLAFSNYFLLYARNIRYYERVCALLPPTIGKVIWNEYYLYKLEQDKPQFLGPLTKLLQNPALGAAFYMLLLLLCVYVLLEWKRRQRAIPEMAPKANESLDFVKTIGRLYYQKGDHKNLAVKMAQHFIEYIRTHYQSGLDLMQDASLNHLYHRSGVDFETIRQIATYIQYVQDAPQITEDQLEEFYQLLQTFYKTAH